AIKKVGSGIKRMSLVGVAALTGLGVALFDTLTIGADFSRALGSAAAKFPGDIRRGTKAFNELREAAREVGKTTEFTSVQAAQGLNFFAKAGFDAAFAMKMLKPTVDFATASELDFATAADIASDALGAFGLDSDDLSEKMAGMNRVMDVMAKAANASNQTVEMLFESVKKGGPVVTAAGGSIETYAALMAVLAANGIKGSEAGTAAKNSILGLAGVTPKAERALRGLGIAILDDSGKLRDQVDVLDDLREKLKTLNDQERLRITKDLFGKLSLASASILLSDAGKKVRGLREEMEKAEGVSGKLAGLIRDDVRGSMDSLKSAIEGVKISIFTMNEGPLKDTIDRMTEWVRANEELIATNIGGFIGDVIANLDEIVASIISVAKWTAGILAAVIALKSLALILTVVNLLMAANPVVLIILGIMAAITAIVLMVKNWEKLKESILGLPDGVLALLGAPLLILKHWEPVKAFFVDLWANVSGFFKAIANAPGVALDVVGDALSGGGSDGTDPSRLQVSGPQARAAGIINESRNTESSEVTIRDETGRAEITKRGGSVGRKLLLQPSGVF
ncbi:MAG: phage tail tape measure protein, partial [Gammaproteobacteria bacterium]|nr:phage tail tape measure protein [Gammaproteobacteria bacterium]